MKDQKVLIAQFEEKVLKYPSKCVIKEIGCDDIGKRVR